MSSIDYLPLLVGYTEIRILELHTGNSGSLHYVPLESAPSFLALSYVWGDPTQVEPFFVDGKSAPISKSLSQALRRVKLACDGKYYAKIPNAPAARGSHMRSESIFEHKRVLIWADAICINQKDFEEKAYQVSLMGSIYKRATRVIINLAEDGISDDLAIQQIGTIFAYIGHSIKHANRDDYSSATLEAVPNLAADNQLTVIFKHAWWDRIWTLQETLSARETVFLCGNTIIKWNALQSVCRILSDFDGLAAHHDDKTVLAAADLIQGGNYVKATLTQRGLQPGRTQSWFVMLAVTTQFATTDPRDRLYALIELCEEVPGLTVSYSRPSAEVFHDFTARYLASSGTLELLQLCGVNVPLTSTSPSWVPNYANLNHPMLKYTDRLRSEYIEANIENDLRVWDACNGRGAKLHSTHNPKIICPEGISIDNVIGVNNLNEAWLSYAYTQLGIEYKPPTMQCHILQAYFRTMLGDRNEARNSKLLECKDRYRLAGTFWHTIRKAENDIIQQMNLADRIQDILLGGRNGMAPFTVEAGVIMARLTLVIEQKQSLHLFITADGYMGYGPECQKGDVVCVVFGCSVPLMLRQRSDGGWTVVGQCFVLGIMNGELCHELIEQDDHKTSESPLRKKVKIFDIY